MEEKHRSNLIRYVRRTLLNNPQSPREHLDSSRDLMILLEDRSNDESFLVSLRDYFAFYGHVYACKYNVDLSFPYILVEFADYGK
jgi:hypothetical protein